MDLQRMLSARLGGEYVIPALCVERQAACTIRMMAGADAKVTAMTMLKPLGPR